MESWRCRCCELFSACRGSRSRMGSRRCSWQTMLPGVSLGVLLVAVHFFVPSLVPTFSEDSGGLVFHQIDGTYWWGGERPLTCKKHGAIVYRNATWKAEVGCWLSQCGNSAIPIPVVEVSVGKSLSCWPSSFSLILL